MLLLPAFGGCWTDLVPKPATGAECQALGAAQFPGPCKASLGLIEVSKRIIMLVPGSFVAPGITSVVPKYSCNSFSVSLMVLSV